MFRGAPFRGHSGGTVFRGRTTPGAWCSKGIVYFPRHKAHDIENGRTCSFQSSKLRLVALNSDVRLETLVTRRSFSVFSSTLLVSKSCGKKKKRRERQAKVRFWSRRGGVQSLTSSSLL